MATLEGCPSGLLIAPAAVNLRLVTAAGESFVGWSCVDAFGTDPQFPDVTNPGYGIINVPAGTYTCTGIYANAAGTEASLTCTFTVINENEIDGCPTEPVTPGSSLSLSSPAASGNTYEWALNETPISGAVSNLSLIHI